MNWLNATQTISLLIGFVTFMIGVFAVLKPEMMSAKFGIIASGKTLPYVISTGIRDVFMGLVVLILFFLNHVTALGWIHLCLGVVALSDFTVVRRHGDKKTSLVHLVSAVAVVVYGIWLLILKRNDLI